MIIWVKGGEREREFPWMKMPSFLLSYKWTLDCFISCLHIIMSKKGILIMLTFKIF
jgi:hypothetical protein